MTASRRSQLFAAVLLVLPAVALSASPPANFNAAFGDRARSYPKRSLNHALLEGLVDPGAPLHVDELLGVPRLLFAHPSLTLQSVAPGLQGATPETAARAYLYRFAPAYRLGAQDVTNARVRDVHDLGHGAIIVSFTQATSEAEVFGDELRVVMDRSLKLVSISGNFSPYARGARGSWHLQPVEALADAFIDLTGRAMSPNDLEAIGDDESGYQLFRQRSTMSDVALLDIARVRRVMFALPDRLVAGFYVEVQAGSPIKTEADAYFSYVISAETGEVLFRNNLTQSHSYRVFADNATSFPYDGPQGWDPTPHPTGIPDGYQAPFFPGPTFGANLNNVPALFTRATAGDNWLAANATVTTGNNADAYADLGAPNGFNNGDVRPNTTSAATFDYAFDPNQGPQVSTNQEKAAVVDLFYMNNFMHDWYYDSGFTETARNAQSNNYGRGGVQADPILAEGQDYSGTDNANMSTPADGQSPRMQMYVFTGNGGGSVTINSPANLAGTYGAGVAGFGPTTFDVTANLVAAIDSGGVSTTDGCEAITNGAQVTGKIALVDRGTCNFTVKVKNCQNAGAVAVIIANNTTGVMDVMGGTDGTITIGSLMVSQAQGATWRGELANNTVINTRARRIAVPNRDGTVDNTIIAHEWTHYLSNRLINNGNGLNNNQGGSMGEGWSDFAALHLIVRAQDAALPVNVNYSGVYALAGYVMGGGQNGGINQGYYFGIRRVPYSTDLTKNDLTYANIQDYRPLDASVPTSFGLDGADNSEVHNGGEVWTTMLWECYAGILRDTLGSNPRLTFAQAQTRMKDYLVAGLKATPSNPTYLEARDALLGAIQASDAADHRACFIAFAKRGAGKSAKGPDRNSTDHSWVTESFSPDIEFVSASLNDSGQSCDSDGNVDSNETGTLTVTVRNVGIAAFTGTTVTVTSTTPGVTFPNGNTVTLPSYAPLTTANATFSVKLPGGLTGAQTADFNFAITDPQMLVPRTINQPWSAATNVNLATNTSATDTTEGPTNKWTASGTPANALDQWTIVEGTPGNHWWRTTTSPATSDQILTSPPFSVGANNLTVTLKHRYRFDEGTNFQGAPVYYDGAIVQCSPDGTNWFDIPAGTGRTLTAGGTNPIRGKVAFAGMSANYPAFVTDTITSNATQCRNAPNVRIRLRAGSDAANNKAGWEVDEITIGGGATSLPFDTRIADPGTTPVANAGADFAVAERTAGVQLDASGSSDCDGDALTYVWTAPNGITLSSTTAQKPTFTAPEVGANTPFTFSVAVTDADGKTTNDSVVVTVQDVNRPPVANAGPAQTVSERTTVTLAGTVTDPDLGAPNNDTLTYAWTQPNGQGVTLAGANTLTPTFTAPEVGSGGGTFTFTLTATDSKAAKSSSTVTITVANVNRAPTANAGAAQTVNERASVTLSGSATDADLGAPNNDTLTYAWTQTAGTPVTLSGASTLTPSFTAPEVGAAGDALTFTLTVTDSANAQATSTVTVTVSDVNRAPTANAGAALSADERTAVMLSGTATDPDQGAPNNDTLTYAWTQTAGTPVTLSGGSTLTPSFTAPEVGAVGDTLGFQLTVTDSHAATATSSVTVAIANVNRPPVVDAGPAQVADERTTVTLAGSAMDPDTVAPNSDVLTFSWSQPNGQNVTLNNASTLTPDFVAPEIGASPVTLTFTLSVSDGTLTVTSTTTVTVNPVNRAPVANAGPDQSADERTVVTLVGSGTDSDGDPLTYQWTQVAGPMVTLSDATNAAPTFTAPDVTTTTTLTFALTVNDGVASSTADTVDVVVANVNRAPFANAGLPQTVKAGATVTLDGSMSADPDGDALTFAWSQTGGGTVDLSGLTTATTSFTAPDVAVDTALTFALTVNDGSLTSAPSTVTITVQPATSGNDGGSMAGNDGGSMTGGDGGEPATDGGEMIADAGNGGPSIDDGGVDGLTDQGGAQVKPGCGCGAADTGAQAGFLVLVGFGVLASIARKRRTQR